MFFLIYFCSLIVPSLSVLGVGFDQSVAVTGQLMCNGAPATNVKVKLYEDEITLDHLMAEGVSNSTGGFYLQGVDTAVTTIDPRVNIYHTCNYGGLCYKKIGINIPKDYTSEGSTPLKVFDVGTINLANQFTGETTDCLN